MTDQLCGSCGAAIIWATTAGGKRMPVDAAPRIGGNIQLNWNLGRAGQSYPTATVLTKAQLADTFDVLYQAHFVTCPHAASHRRAR
jgi:hypothetical protein